MGRRLIAVPMVGALALIGSACANEHLPAATTEGTVVSTTATPVDADAASTTAGGVGSTTTSATTVASTVTTSTEAGDTVGDPAALAELIAEITDQVRIVYADESLEVPVPNLTTADPVVAAGVINEFDQLTGGTVPFRDWAKVMAYPGSPAEDALVASFNELAFANAIRFRPEAPFEFNPGEIADPDAFRLPADTLDGMPPETIAVTYDSTSGPLLIVDRESGSLVRSLSEGWREFPTVMLLVPTALGWRVWDTLPMSDLDG